MNWIKRLGGAVLALLASVFGVWSAPGWLRWTGGKLAAAARALAGRPVVSLIGLLVLAALVAGGVYGFQWWKSRPQPVEVTLSVENPGLTRFVAPGESQHPPEPVLVTFSDSVAPLSAVDKEVTEGIHMSPALAGTWKWLDDTRLSFQPSAEWPVGETFKVRLDPKVLAPQVRLEEHEFKFKSASFGVKVLKAAFHQDPRDPADKRGLFTLKFTHPVAQDRLPGQLELRMDGQSEGVMGIGRERTEFSVSYDKTGTEAYVTSARLPIPAETTGMKLTLAAGTVSALGGPGTSKELQAHVNVPGRFGLTISRFGVEVVSNERLEPEHALLIETSQPVLSADVAKQLAIWLLPAQDPSARQAAVDGALYPWSDPSQVTDQILAASTRQQVQLVPADEDLSQTHLFRVTGPVGRALYVRVNPGITSFGGYQMRQAAHSVKGLDAFPPALRIMGQGSLLAMSGEKKLGVLVRDLPGIKVELGRVLPNQVHHWVSLAQGSFARPQFYGRFGVDNLTDRFDRTVSLSNLAPGKAHHEAIDLGAYLMGPGEPRRGLFLVTVKAHDAAAERRAKAREQEQAERQARLAERQQLGLQGEEDDASVEDEESYDHEGEYDGGHDGDGQAVEDRRLVLVTDLGLVVKRSVDGSRDVFVQSIHDGQPVSGATVEVLARNGSVIASQTTDANGRAWFDKVDGLVRERTPLMVMVRKGGDMSFISLEAGDRTLDMSRFDVGGVVNARSGEQLSAYLFSDRGIYRPGETLHIGMIIKSQDWARSLAGVPLEAELLDARGLTVKRERFQVAAGGFNEFTHQTLETSPTGNYVLKLHIVKDDRAERLIGSTTVKVQEFLPDRTKVVARLSQPSEGWVHPKDLKLHVEASNLFGTPATQRKVETSMSLDPTSLGFRSHPNHQFADPSRARQGVQDALPDAVTGDNGVAEVELKLNRFQQATYRLNLLTKVYEPDGGRSVSAAVSALVSDWPYLVGVRHDGDMGHVSLGSKRISHVLAIDPQARATAVEGITLQLVEVRTVSMLIRQNDGSYRYESRPKEVEVTGRLPLKMPAAGAQVTLRTDAPGAYRYVVRDAQGHEMNAFGYQVAGTGNVSRSLERNAELLLTLDRKDYAPGDEIEVGIRAPYVGAGLITIERDKVYSHHWFKTTTTSSVQKIRLPKDFEGNGYVSVQFLRDPSSDEIFMSPLSHGAVPFATSLSQRTVNLSLDAPAVIKPGQALKLRLKSDQPTRAVVFAVDEGILQVARHKTADPLGHFFQKRALEVKTTQLLDLLLPEFKQLMQQAAPGGDEGGAEGRFLNPFKRKGEAPAVYWSGIVDVKDVREFSYTVPDHFNGQLRVVALAVSDAAVGVARKDTTVRGDFILSPNLPLAVAPGDEFEVSVGVANNLTPGASRAPQPLQLKLVAPATLGVVGSATQDLSIAAQREGVARFRLKALPAGEARLGSATLEFRLTAGDKSAVRKMDVSVRPAVARATTVSLGHFTGATDVAVPRVLLPQQRSQVLSVSAGPLALVPGLMGYLDDFSHQCTEQTVSRAFPAVVFAKRPDFGLVSGASAAERFQSALRIVRERQNAQGGFGTWKATVESDEFATVYAVHWLMEARDANAPGVVVPGDMLRKGMDQLASLTTSEPADLAGARVRAYALYLLTRDGAVTTPVLARLRETMERRFAQEWRTDSSAAFLAATYQLLKQERPARELIAGVMQGLEKGLPAGRFVAYHDPLVNQMQTLYLVGRHFPDRLPSVKPSVLTAAADALRRGQYNTLSSAYTVLAFEAMAGAGAAGGEHGISAQRVDANKAVSALPLPGQLMSKVPVPDGTVQLKLKADSKLTSYFSLLQSGYDRAPPTEAISSGLEVHREYLGADGKPVTKVSVGQEVTVQLRVRAVSADGSPAHVPNVAISDLLPGGFEPVQNGGEGPAHGVSGPGLAHVEVREDRVVMHTEVSGSLSTFSHRLRATNVGEFTVPAAQAESLYERDRFARSVSSRIVVQAK